MPSEPELARRRTVSRSSMRAAIAMLEEDGYVSRRHGSGTYVTHRPALPHDLGRNFGVSSLIASTGLQPGTVEESSGAVPAPAAVAEALGVEVGEPVSSLCRVRTAGGRRVVDVMDWCRTDHLAPEDLAEIGEGSIYEALAERGLTVDHGVAYLTPRNADGDVARRLAVPSGTLLLTIDQVDRTADGVAVLVSVEHHLADAFTFTLVRRGPAGAGEDEP
jgi:DNA-binding GntR family transcriptional regulator